MITRVRCILPMVTFVLVACARTDASPLVSSVPATINSPLAGNETNRPAFDATVPTATAGSIATPLIADAIKGEFNVRKALEVMYGSEATSITDDAAIIPAPIPDYATTVRVSLAAAYQENGVAKHLVITDSSFDTCHACQAVIDGAIFSATAEGWRLETLSKGIVKIGSFGYASRGQLVQIGPDKFGALLVSEYAGQGYQSSTTVILTNIGKGLEVIFNVLTTESEDQPYLCQQMKICKWGYDSRLIFVEKEGASFYNIQLVVQGTDRDGRSLHKTRTYVFFGTQYVLVREKS